MAKPTLDETLSLPDVLQQDNFEFLVTRAPINQPDIRNMRLTAMNLTVPGRTLEKAPVPLHGYEISFAGRNTNPHQFQCTFVETRAFTNWRALKYWMEYARSSETQHGTSKQFYAGTAEITILSEAGIPVAVMELRNLFPEAVPDTNFDSSATGIIQLPVTFHFDEFRWLEDGGAAPSDVFGGVGG